MSDDAIYIGVNLPAKQGVSNQLIVDAAINQGYDLITSRITSSVYRKRVQNLYASLESDPEVPVPINDDLVVFPGNHISNTIALCAPWTELDSKDLRIADLSLKVLTHEMAYAKFCGMPYVVIEGPKRRTHLARYAHSLAKLVRKFPELKIMVHTTFSEDYRDGVPPSDPLSTWDVWDGVRVMSGSPPNLGVTLEVQNLRLPDFVISRWLCEPVMMLVLGEATTFVPNAKNYPVLPRYTQAIVRRFAALRPFILVKENLTKPSKYNGGEGAAQIYLRNLLCQPDFRLSHASQQSRVSQDDDTEPNRSKNSVLSDSLSIAHSHGSASTNSSSNGSNNDRRSSDMSSLDLKDSACFCESYADVLEKPLEPLSSALDSSIYEVFETDETKYNQYYLAILHSLTEILEARPASRLAIAVLGAGRGALVDRVLDALVAKRITSPVTVYAVEKHAGPVAFLHARKASEPVWERVEIVHVDMRDWVPRHPVQLIVSELLGSFGDNELSPECIGNLPCNPRVLDQTVGIMIPTSYTSYVAPIFSPQLWSKAKQGVATAASYYATPSSQTGLEQSYVVCLHQAERLADPLPAWTFRHSRGKAPQSNRRQAKLSFNCSQRSRAYGFAGYFEATLAPGITLSTLQSTRTRNLTSWFPMYFPIKEPLDVFPDSQVDISLWRESTKHKCWYEWGVETSFRRSRSGMSTIHNCDGHAQSMQL